MTIDDETLDMWQAQAAAEGRQCVVGGLIVNEDGRIFVQKRNPERPLFPDCWDIAGGHVESGETLYQALEREIQEETGWQLSQLIALVETFDWDTDEAGKVIARREFDFLVTAVGDLERPQIEQDKFSEYRWIGSNELEILKEGRPPSDQVIYNLVTRAMKLHLARAS